MSRTMGVLAAALMLIGSSTDAWSASYIHRSQKTYTNICPNAPAARKNCAIKQAKFETRVFVDVLHAPDDPILGTLFSGGFEADSWSDVPNYGFVQYIRGCTYDVTKNPDGTVTKRIGEAIRHLGKRRIFVMPTWSFDANTNDPLYYGPAPEDSGLPGGRLAHYQWEPVFGEFNQGAAKSYYEVLKLPAAARAKLVPNLFVTDGPSPASRRGPMEFRNIALEFKMCLYRMKDIPLEVQDDTPLAAKPLLCHEWDSQLEYDFVKAEYVHKPGAGLNSFCAAQEPISPLQAYRRERQAKNGSAK